LCIGPMNLPWERKQNFSALKSLKFFLSLCHSLFICFVLPIFPHHFWVSLFIPLLSRHL
jgi:hypothetical protein